MGDVVLEVSDLRVRRERDVVEALRGVSFTVRAGEVLGIAGVEGNGQAELIETLAGLHAPASGTVRLPARDITSATPAERFALGVAHVPDDRHRRGLVLDFTVTENLILGRQREFSGRFGLDRTRIDAHAEALIEHFDVRPPEPLAQAATLSGGTQQKIVMARERSRPGLRLLLCAQPTRGVDIRASHLIHQQIRAARDAGAAVLLVSSELQELRELADRIAVIYRGLLVTTLDVLEATDDVLGELMTGARALGSQPVHERSSDGGRA
jgi:simple sugar transport system ATP-binding protein